MRETWKNSVENIEHSDDEHNILARAACVSTYIHTDTYRHTRASNKPEPKAGGRVCDDETEVLTRYMAIIAVVTAVVPSAGGT